MTELVSATITTAAANVVSTPLQLRPVEGATAPSFSWQGNFTYGSGGTTVDAYVQTSMDGGGTWCDICHFAFTTSSLRTIAAASRAATFTQGPATDGSLAAGTVNVGIIGTLWRVKYTTVGTYAGGTTLRVDMIAEGLTSSP